MRAGRAEVESFAGEGAEILIFAVRIGALNAGNPLGIVSAADELLHHLRDTLDAEAAIDDGVFVLVLISETLEVFLNRSWTALIPLGRYTRVVSEGRWRDS